MLNIIGLTQFVFLSLGLMAVNILVKASAGVASPLSLFLYRNGLWLFLIPTAWILFATVFTLRSDKRGAFLVARLTGILITVAIFLAFGAAVLLP